jgi:N-acetylglucosaminyldiphosphoundecaprenol N-acetyl-beta-D-mannosaminyltransferase
MSDTQPARNSTFSASETALPHQSPEMFYVLGLPVHLLPDYTNWLMTKLHQGQGAHVVTLNAEMAIQAEQNPDLANIIHKAELVIPDGAGIVLFLRFKGRKINRCPGIELAELLLQNSASAIPNQPCSIVFYGGAPGVSQTAAEKWRERSPGIAIAHIQHGYLSPEEQPAFLQTLQALQPQIILVGLGVPRQEFWIAIWIGVGGSFDIWAGTKTRAPGWLRNNNLEWVYRLYQEPWRWRRMLALPEFAWKVLVRG